MPFIKKRIFEIISFKNPDQLKDLYTISLFHKFYKISQNLMYHILKYLTIKDLYSLSAIFTDLWMVKDCSTPRDFLKYINKEIQNIILENSVYSDITSEIHPTPVFPINCDNKKTKFNQRNQEKIEETEIIIIMSPENIKQNYIDNLLSKLSQSTGVEQKVEFINNLSDYDQEALLGVIKEQDNVFDDISNYLLF